MTTSSKVAVCGVSHWHADMHLGGLKRVGAQIVGIHDEDLSVATKIASEQSAPEFVDLAEMVRSTRPDLVVALGTPTAVLNSARWLIANGVPCIVEKPIGLTGTDIVPLLDAARAANAFASVPLVNRYSELWRRLEQLRDDGSAGDVVHANFRVVNGPPERYQTMRVPWMLDAASSGGGCMRNLGIHCVDAFAQLVGDDGIEVICCAMDTRRDDLSIETYAVATLRSTSGVIGTIEAGYTFAAKTGGDTEWRVATANAYLADQNQSLRTRTLDDDKDSLTRIPSVADRYDQYIADTLARLAAGRPPRVSLEDYVRATLIIDEMYRTAVRSRSRATVVDADATEGMNVNSLRRGEGGTA